MEGLTKEDYDYFRTQGFEVVHGSNGKYYIRPAEPMKWRNLDDYHQSKATAIQCGFSFDMQGNILNYERRNSRKSTPEITGQEPGGNKEVQ